MRTGPYRASRAPARGGRPAPTDACFNRRSGGRGLLDGGWASTQDRLAHDRKAKR
jgi:hypothetical protein